MDWYFVIAYLDMFLSCFYIWLFIEIKFVSYCQKESVQKQGSIKNGKHAAICLQTNWFSHLVETGLSSSH